MRSSQPAREASGAPPNAKRLWRWAERWPRLDETALAEPSVQISIKILI
jgi:hypothetical protein